MLSFIPVLRFCYARLYVYTHVRHHVHISSFMCSCITRMFARPEETSYMYNLVGILLTCHTINVTPMIQIFLLLHHTLVYENSIMLPKPQWCYMHLRKHVRKLHKTLGAIGCFTSGTQEVTCTYKNSMSSRHLFTFCSLIESYMYGYMCLLDTRAKIHTHILSCLLVVVTNR